MSKKGKIILGVLGVAALIVGAWYWYNQGKINTDDAQVDGRVYMITSRVAGYVDSVSVQDNDRVKAGQVLVRLDPSEYRVALAEAQAQLAALKINVPLERSQTGYQVSEAQAGVQGSIDRMAELTKEESSARYDVERYSTNLAQAMLDLTRIRNLAARGAVSRSQLDLARTQEEVARASLEAAKSKLEAASSARAAMASTVQQQRAAVGLAGTGSDVVEIRKKQYDAQLERVKQAELNLEWTEIKAPVDGFVTNRNVAEGKMISRGQPLMAIVPLSADEVWITANFKETEISNMREGQYAEIKVDAYPDHTFKAEVESLMSGTGSAFSLFPPENASGNYVKVVQRIPVRLRLTDYDPVKGPVLRIGMSVTPTIYVNDFMANSGGKKPSPAPEQAQTPENATKPATEPGTMQPAPAVPSNAAPSAPPAVSPATPPASPPAAPANTQKPLLPPMTPPSANPTYQPAPNNGGSMYSPEQSNSPSLYTPDNNPPAAPTSQQSAPQTMQQADGNAVTLSPNAITAPNPTSSANPVQEPSAPLSARQTAQ